MKQPYIHGIIDTLAGATLIRQFDVQHKNRLGVILLDSAFETACRAYLKYVAKIPLSDSHQQRHTLVKTIKSKLTDIDQDVWDKIDWYYTEIRCDFYHQSAGKTIIDTLYLDYKDIVEFVIDRALGIHSSKLVEEEIQRINEHHTNSNQEEVSEIEFDFQKNKEIVDRVLAAVHASTPQKVDDINAFFKKKGLNLKLTPADFNKIACVNSGSKKFFYHDKSDKTWKLSDLGIKYLEKINSK
jgi:hypothetical protein